MNDMRVRVKNQNAFYYPDVLVGCGPRMHALDSESSTVFDPLLIVEGLSVATEATDRREKLLAYRTLPSLAEYVLVSQDRARVEIYRRRGDIHWELIEFSAGEPVRFDSIDLTLAMREIYEGIPVDS
jgi:Uma2 family endonuclease